MFLGIWNNPCSLVETFASETVPRRYIEKIQNVRFLSENNYLGFPEGNGFEILFVCLQN